MGSLTVASGVTSAYVLFSAIRLFAYTPPIRGLVRGECVEGVSLASWLIFGAAHASTSAYAVVIQGDAALAWSTAFNAIACFAIVVLAWYRRRNAAVQTASRSAVSDDCGGTDTSLLDAVTRDERDAVRLHLRAFGLATGIRMRAARVKGAA